MLADRELLRQAKGLGPDAARRLLDLQLAHAQLHRSASGNVARPSTPAADARRSQHTTIPSGASRMPLIQNLWLAARAEGLGLGWVTLFRPEELAGLVGLPEGVLTLGWLCPGWPDARPPEPGLVRAG